MANKVSVYLSLGAWIVLGLLLYAKTFYAPFLFDDEALIVRNPLVWDLSHGFDSLKNIYSYQPSRIFTNITVAINYQMGLLNVIGYHVFNWIVHILVTAGVWYLTQMMIDIKKIKTTVNIAFWASLLFLVHPLHTESVSYINHRSSLLVTVFYLWSIIFYLKARTVSDLRQQWGYFVCAGVLAVFALLSKESGWTLPIAWMVADKILFNKFPKKWVWVSLVAGMGLLFLLFDFKVSQILTTSVYSQSHRGDFLTLGTYLLTQLNVCVVFIRLIFVPVNLNADYDFAMSQTLWEPTTAAALMILVLLSVGAYLYRYRCWFWIWAIAMFFVTLLSHIFPARYNVIAEHKLYLTLAMITPVLTLWMWTLLKERFFIIVAVIIAVFSVLTIERNHAWSHPIRLWHDTTLKSPQKPRPHLNLASALLNYGDDVQAEQMFYKVIQMAPEYVESYINLAQIETNRGNMDKALMYSQRALEVNPSFDIGYLQNGFLNDRIGNKKEAIKSFSQWMKFHPQDGGIARRIQFLEQSP